MKKSYVIDTNVFLQDPSCIEILKNGVENEVYITKRTLLELDGFKKNSNVHHLLHKAIDEIDKNIDYIKIIDSSGSISHPDLNILNDIKNAGIDNIILVTNDKLFRTFAAKEGVLAEEYLNSLPYKSESELYTGFLENKDENPDNIKNYFYWNSNGKVVFSKNNRKEKIIDYVNEIWGGVKPRPISKGRHDDVHSVDIYQNLAIELLMDDDIKVVSLQGPAGGGKSYIGMACAFENVFHLKKYDKIIIIKPIVEMGDELGFMPGDISEKIHPHVAYLDSHVNKLLSIKTTKLIYKKNSNYYNPDVFQIIPMSFLRGSDIENAFVSVEESQNIDRNSMRTILTRLGKNTKCVLNGDIHQIDRPGLSELNNGLNWTVKCLKSFDVYAHLCLKGNVSRGPIAEAVIKSGL